MILNSQTLKYFAKIFLKYKYLLLYENIEIGSNVTLIRVTPEDNVRIKNNVSIQNCSIGRFSYISDNTKINDALIGRFSSIGPNCMIGLGKHPINKLSTHPVFYSKSYKRHNLISFNFKEKETVSIGNDVWIGANCIILDGVKIGNGAVIGAGSIVTKDILDYQIVAGVPAKIIKTRFVDKEKNKSAIEWWNWDLNKIQQNLNLFK